MKSRTDYRLPVWDCWTHFKTVEGISIPQIDEYEKVHEFLSYYRHEYLQAGVVRKVRTGWPQSVVRKVRTGWPQSVSEESWLPIVPVLQLLTLPWKLPVLPCCLMPLVLGWRGWPVRVLGASGAGRGKAKSRQQGETMPNGVVRQRGVWSCSGREETTNENGRLSWTLVFPRP